MPHLKRLEEIAQRHAGGASFLVVLAGLAYRYRIAAESFLNPDEAFHSQLSRQPDLLSMVNNAIIATHPPLILFVTRFMQEFSFSEIVLRTPAILAGGLAPWFAYLWLKRVRGPAAAFIAVVILVMAPNLIMLTTQIRGYNLALFFMAAGLYCLQRGIDDDSPRWITVFSVLCLYPAILSEYVAVLYCGAVGLYALLHYRSGTWGIITKVTWAAGQGGALLLLLLLQRARHLGRGLGGGVRHVQGYLGEMFPQDGVDRLTFLYNRSNDVFDYLGASPVSGSIGFVLFFVGLVMLWTGRPVTQPARPAAAALIAALFGISVAATLVQIYPYGGSRHTIHLVWFGALAVSVALEAAVGRRLVLAGAAAVFLVPWWVLNGPNDVLNVDRESQRKEDLAEALTFFRENVEPGSWVLTESESRLILSHYLDPEATWPRGISSDRSEDSVAGYTLFGPNAHFYSLAQIREEAAIMKKRAGIHPDQEVWVLDTGFHCYTRYHLIQNPQVTERLPVVRNFGPGIVLFRTYPGFETGS